MSRRYLHRVPLVIGIAAVLFGWLGFLAADVFDAFGVRQAVIIPHLDPPVFFLWFFAEAGPVERLQWAFLTVAVTLCAGLAWWCGRQGDRQGTGIFLLGAAGLLLMLLEDAFNVRHQIAFGITMPLFYEGTEFRNHVRTLTELSFYALLGGAMLVLLWAALRHFRQVPGAARLLLTGYVLYAVAAVASATRFIGDWYTAVGSIAEPCLAEGVVEAYRSTDLVRRGGEIGFWVMDWLVEESVELVAVAFIVSALLLVVQKPSEGSGFHRRGG